ncbi:MAG TPA: hypothetical protein VIA18_16550 [Polyangia bacterium]|jgi:hypothetical protein|nr:hypothetical protein [Polyangia bacterium]
MGTLLFGTDETITCIQHIDVKSPKDESLCLAHKFSKLFFGAGVKLSDEGYVLGVEDGAKGKVTSYYRLDAAKIKDLQSQSMLPTPLPKYEIPTIEYAFGYSLWLVLVGTAIWYKVAAMMKTRRLAARAAEVAGRPISYGPPVVETKEDRFIQEQVTPLLQAGEVVQHQAYTFDRVPEGGMQQARATARFVALTNRRLFLFDARVGALGILLENKKTEALARTRIAKVVVDDRTIHLVIDDGSVRTLWVHKTKKLSNQHAFLLDVPRMLVTVIDAVAV